LQIWQLFEAGWFACFFGVKRSSLHIVPILNTQRKPRNILLLFTIWVAVIGSFLTIDARMGRVMKKGVLQSSSLQAHYYSLCGPARGLAMWYLTNRHPLRA
jgi:hypothetical protein